MFDALKPVPIGGMPEVPMLPEQESQPEPVGEVGENEQEQPHEKNKKETLKDIKTSILDDPRRRMLILNFKNDPDLWEKIVAKTKQYGIEKPSKFVETWVKEAVGKW